MSDDNATPNPLLQLLKDIEMPEPVSWWPPAPGWWLLAIAALALLAWIVFKLLRKYQAGAGKREANTTLKAAHATFKETGNASDYLDSVSSLLRRLCIQVQGRRAVARLTGDAWIENLNRLSDNPLTDTSASVLGSARYRADQELPVDQLHPELVALVDGFRYRVADDAEQSTEASRGVNARAERNNESGDTISA